MYYFPCIIIPYTILELPAILRFRLAKDTPEVVRRIGLSASIVAENVIPIS